MKSIGFKLWAGMMALVAVVLVLLWLFQIVFLESFYNNIKVSDMKKECASIAQLYASGKVDDFRSHADELAYNNNLSVELVDTDRKDIYVTGTTGGNGQVMMGQNYARTEAFQKALGGQQSTTELTHPRFGNKFMLITLPVYASGKLSAVLFVNMPLAPVSDTVSILKRQLVVITLIMLAASLLISYRMSKSFTKPILEIKAVSEKMASGDFSSRIATKGNDEIGALAGTINEMGQELSKIDQLRKDLVANVSHELRTPLSIIRGYAETIRDVSGNNAEKREKHVGIIIDESERLKGIVDDILNLSQMQDGILNLYPDIFELDEMLKGVVGRYDLLSEKTGIRISVHTENGLFAYADEKRVEQVMYNLINNAFNHTPDGGNIHINAVKDGMNIRVEVVDTGEGISEQDLKHVWDRFYKSDKNTRKAIGTGLGLAIVKNILDGHKASYGVDSKEGKGTTFWFELEMPDE